MSAIGKSVPNVDGRAKVTGHIRYTGDVSLPGQWYVAAARSPYPHALVTAVDCRPALEKYPDVVTLTGADVQDTYRAFGPVIRDQSVVATERVRFVGDIVAAVAAPNLETARKAVALLDIEYEELPAIFDPEAAFREDAPEVHPNLAAMLAASLSGSIQPGLELLGSEAQRNVCSVHRFAAGDFSRSSTEAARIYRNRYTTPTIQHAHIEPHVAIAHWEQPEQLTVYSSTQDPYVVSAELASIFGIQSGDVRVIAPRVGGGYGAKLYPRIEPVVAALARKAGRPAKWVLTREEVFQTIVRHASVVELETAVGADGRLLGRRVDVTYDGGAYAEISPRVVAQNGPIAPGPYDIANVQVELRCVYTNKTPAGAFRGFGVPQLSWAYESQMDEIARDLGLDPLEIRRRNLLRNGDVFTTGEVLAGFSVDECLTRVAQEIGWAADPSRAGEGAGANRRRAKGLACSIKSTMTPSHSSATVRLSADGSVHVLTSSVELGQGSATVLAQIAADALGVPFERVHVVAPDTWVTPFDHGTKSSRATFSVGNSVLAAARDVKRQLLELACRTFGIPVADLDLSEGFVNLQGREVGVMEIFKEAYGVPVGSLVGHATYQSEGGLDPRTGRGRDSAFWMAAAAGAEVEVDLELGAVRVLRLVAAVDPGRAINPKMCEMQVEGSMIMALSSALMEELVYDGGQPINGSFLNYSLPLLRDIPELTAIIVENADPDGPYGARGVGEAALVPVAPAIGNAVANALGGVTLRDLPLTPERVIDAIGVAS